ncbi:MAG: hypothetical protein BroJett011_51660 [Chloroflexota bacterium]|nr:MAG: hypothetical protein BroJett011_51660 [Chloroflexota bacterium]
MKRFLLIITGGLAIWGLSLVWPYVNTVLTPEAADAIIVGMVVATAAYLLGRQFTGNDMTGAVEPVANTRESTRPSVPIINPFGRTSQATIIPRQSRPGFHSRVTQPVPAFEGRVHHSRITRPMPVGR